MSFLPFDIGFAAVPGYAINVAGWVLLAAVSMWQKKII